MEEALRKFHQDHCTSTVDEEFLGPRLPPIVESLIPCIDFLQADVIAEGIESRLWQGGTRCPVTPKFCSTPATLLYLGTASSLSRHEM